VTVLQHAAHDDTSRLVKAWSTAAGARTPLLEPTHHPLPFPCCGRALLSLGRGRAAVTPHWSSHTQGGQRATGHVASTCHAVASRHHS